MLLVRHGATYAVHANAFADGEPLEPRARDRVTGLAASLPRRHRAACGPEPACRETAEQLEIEPAVVDQLAGCDVGGWCGRTLDDVAASDPEGLMAWMSDADAAPHGGESLAGFADRVAGWMEQAADTDGYLIAVVDAGVVKTGACRAIGAPLSGFWRIDVAPLNVTELHARDGRWTLCRLNAPLARSDGLRYR